MNIYLNKSINRIILNYKKIKTILCYWKKGREERKKEDKHIYVYVVIYFDIYIYMCVYSYILKQKMEINVYVFRNILKYIWFYIFTLTYIRLYM